MLNVSQRQLNLKTCGFYYTLEVDGIEGAGTIEAYKKFQEDFHLVVDGIYGTDTEKQLISYVQNFQSKLNRKGYNLVIDGIVGNATLGAIKDFQSKNNLEVDGIIGINTMKALGKYQCVFFAESEFTCECGCGLNLQKDGIKIIADEIREHFGVPVDVSSGTRCKNFNSSLKNADPYSWHRYGNAMDIRARGISGSKLLEYCQRLVNQGRANYCYQIDSEYVHIDTGNLE